MTVALPAHNKIAGPPDCRARIATMGSRLLEGLRALRTAGARVAYVEGALLTQLKDLNRFEDTGHVRFGDFCREAMQVQPKTARRRIAAHALLRDRSAEAWQAALEAGD